MLITEFLDLAALLVPERTAIAFEGERYSYARLKERVNRLADSLNKLGLVKGGGYSGGQLQPVRRGLFRSGEGGRHLRSS
jgi:acyl-CoA synthetase (AMP-forming)/AMP-acid ligase II